MRVNPYIEPLLHNATDLLNRPPTSVEELERRWLDWGLIQFPHPVTADDLDVVLAYLEQWGHLVDAPGERERVLILNAMLARFTAPPSVTDHDGSEWHLHYRDPAATFGMTLAGSTSASAAQFLCDRGMQRLGRCGIPECRRAFVDVSRPGRQRYCTQACGNRAAVRRHRASARG
ncbi:CGNR zinc finger domain-containing protein [Williamsia sterculiae]|uniref:CGNR zinc finger domain-containing protein n=1 Tax=Williamsia sterculiae TaxID=1344003 RepID=A0A1N7EZA2_9NOCA|nr:CGNR zinc finger domain-containing protein [Williamsia sterculiae]SIR93322.1 CGNR zinc finger domain-containing protein [Williamsia sterculiae]